MQQRQHTRHTLYSQVLEAGSQAAGSSPEHSALSSLQPATLSCTRLYCAWLMRPLARANAG